MNLQVLVSSRRAFLRAVVAAMFVVITAMPVVAQVSALSSIRGTVSDATGAALPGVVDRPDLDRVVERNAHGPGKEREPAHETREDQALDMELAAASCAKLLGSHRESARHLGLSDPIEEVITTAGARQLLVRALQRHPDLVLVALLEKHRTNLALARFQLLEVERSLP